MATRATKTQPKIKPDDLKPIGNAKAPPPMIVFTRLKVLDGMEPVPSATPRRFNFSELFSSSAMTEMSSEVGFLLKHNILSL